MRTTREMEVPVRYGSRLDRIRHVVDATFSW